MERIGREVRGALRGAGVPDAGALADVVRAWPGAVGREIARAAWPLRISRDGTLHVAAASSTWAFELGRLEPEIRPRLAAAVGDGAPTALRFAVGPVPEPAAEEETAPPPALAHTPETAAAAAALASTIDAPELREAVRAAAAASLAARRADRDL